MWRRREKTGTALYLDSRHGPWMLFRTRYNVLFRQFRLLTAQAGSIPAAIRLIFENCYKGARVAAPSVCFAAARILLAAAPTAPPCFRHWRRSSPLQVA